MSNKKLIKKGQSGLVTNTVYMNNNNPIRGTWGNRGTGNELESALENGLSTVWNGVKWVGDKFINMGDYIDQGLSYLVALPEGVEEARKAAANKRLEQTTYLQDMVYPQQATSTESNSDLSDQFLTSDLMSQMAQGYLSNPYWIDVDGNIHEHDMELIGLPPSIQPLPQNAPKTLVDVYNNLKRLAQSWTVGERRFITLGRTAEDFERSSKTVTRFNQLMKEYKEGLAALGKTVSNVDDVKLHGRQQAAFKSGKYMASQAEGTVGDLRVLNQGRPAMKRAQWDEVERVMRTDRDPKVQSMLNRYDVKKGSGINEQALKDARKKMLEWYVDRMPGFFDYLYK